MGERGGRSRDLAPGSPTLHTYKPSYKDTERKKSKGALVGPSGSAFPEERKGYAKRGSDKGGYPHGLGKKKLAAGGSSSQEISSQNLARA